MSSKHGLGKGLGALMESSHKMYGEALPDNKPEAEQKEAIAGAVEVSIGSIKPNPYQPRKIFDKENLAELADSIREHGIIQPLIVCKKGTSYELVAGERRLRAAKLAKLKTVPVLIREYTEIQKQELALVENIQRKDLNPLEEAKAIRELMEKCSYTQAVAARKVGRSRAAVANLLRILNLPKELQEMVEAGKVTAGQIRPVLSLENTKQQLEVGMALAEHAWSARTVEEVVKNLKEGKAFTVISEKVLLNQPKAGKSKKKAKDQNEPDVHFRQFEDDLISLLGTKVKITAKDRKSGKIEIEYYSPEDLDRICVLLQGKNDRPAPPEAPWLKKITV